MFRWSIIFLIIAVAATLFAFGGSDHDSRHLGLYIAFISIILALGAILLRRRSDYRGKP